MKLAQSPSSGFQYRALLFVILALTAVFILFFQLGARDFENKDTARYAEIAWEMISSGDYLVPRFNGIIFTEKPILLIWLIAFFSNLAGAITPLTVRLPSALSALGCVFLVYALGTRIFGWRGGLLAGFVLCTNYAFAWEARASRTDMLLTFFVSLSLFLLHAGFRSERSKGRYFILAYVAAGLAALAKGPIGIGLPAIVFFLYLLWRRRLGMIREMRLFWGVVIVVAIQAAWYAPFLVRIGPGGRAFFYDMYIYKENLLRFTTGFDHYEPPWFYVPALLSRFLPWSPFLLVWPVMMLADRRKGGAAETGRDWRFPAAWFLGIFAFLTISSGKHSRYALPLYPAAALLAADVWDRLLAREPHRAWRAVTILLAAVLIAGAVGFPIACRFLVPRIFYGSFAAAGGMIILALSLLRSDAKAGPALVFAALAFAFLCGWSLYVEQVSSGNFHRARQRRLAAEIAPLVRGRSLAAYGPSDDRFGRRLALGFYLGRKMKYIDRRSDLLDYLASDERVFCLMRRGVYENLSKRYGNIPPPLATLRYKKADLVLISNGKKAPAKREHR